MKKYTYYFSKTNVTIEADNGREAEAKYRELYGEGDYYSGVIELTNNITGEKSKLLPIKFA